MFIFNDFAKGWAQRKWWKEKKLKQAGKGGEGGPEWGDEGRGVRDEEREVGGEIEGKGWREVAVEEGGEREENDD